MRLNNKWMTHHGTLVRCTLASVALLLLLFTFCKRCTQMGGPAANEVYVPAADKGFVMKANQLLAHLVEATPWRVRVPPTSAWWG